MTKLQFFVMLAVLLIIFCMFFAVILINGGFSIFAISDYSTKSFDLFRPKVTVYICGAVENEGEYTLEYSTTFANAANSATVTPNSDLSELYSQQVTEATTFILVPYFDENGDTQYPIELNHEYFNQIAKAAGIQANVIELINAYRSKFGLFSDKKQLKDALGELYRDNYYKFYLEKGN